LNFDLRQLGLFTAGCALALVSVFGANWLVSRQADAHADQHLHEQLDLARRGSDAVFAGLIEELQSLAAVEGVACGLQQRVRMTEATVLNPAVSVAAVFTFERQPVCSVPEITATSLELIREPMDLENQSVSLSQVRVLATRMTGIMLELPHRGRLITVMVPRVILPHFFDAVDPSAGVVLSMDDAVLYSRDPQFLDINDRTEIEVQSVASDFGTMRVQVSLDRRLAQASFANFRRWATAGAMLAGAFMVLLITRLAHYTPKQINEIERAINNNEFVPFYQPVIDVSNGKLVGCEVLVRWIKPNGKMVSPGAFIGLAEQTGLAVPMTRSLMRTVVRDVEQAYAGRRGLKVAINLFNHHFTNLDIIQDVEEIFGPSKIAYSQLVLEITERAPLESVSQAKVIMRKLQRLGCRLALDDAGTGHGGLAYLQELGLDIVKIDKMFIDQLGKSHIGESITHTLTELAHDLDMDVVAEGVETVEQVAHLKRLGIRQAQGYLFAPALPAEQYLALVEKLGTAVSSDRKSDKQSETDRKAATLRAAAEQITQSNAA
jgi:sensor c-di-GMP phosphodiesterase-like protein